MIFTFLIFLASCAKKVVVPVIPKTGVELVAIGAVNFGGLVVGNYRDAAIRIYNYGPDILDTSKLTTTLTNPFSIQSISSPCSSGKLKANENCIVAIRFLPTDQGDYSQDFKLLKASLTITGRGMIDGVMSLSDAVWDIGNIIAGDEYRQTVTISNNGDFTIQSPNIILPTGLSVGYNNCGSYINSRKDCSIELISNKVIKGSYNENISFISGNQSLGINFLANVVPTEPSGIITFQNPPTTLVADGSTELTIITDVIKDRFGNIVKDGTNVSFNGNNLNLMSPNVQQTVNGIVSFVLRATSTRGLAIATLISGEAVGVLRLQAQAGDPYGLISLESFSSNIVANGTSQIVFRTLPLFDSFGNVIEDGTNVFYTLEGAGTLSVPFSQTLFGVASFVLTAPKVTGSAVLKIRSGPIFDSNNNIIDYKSKGDYQINYIPDEPFGNIPVNPTHKGIYFEEDFTVEQSGINVRTQVVIGPVKDSNNNIVANNTPIEVSVSNGKLLYKGSNPSTFNTDINGYIYATVAGNSSHGKIQITASHFKGATGNNWVWAFLDQAVIYSPLPDNQVFLYETYDSSTSLPDVNKKWSLAVDYAGISIADNNNQYGFQVDNFELMNSTSKNLLVQNVVYLPNECWISNDHYLVLAPCVKNDDMAKEGPYVYDLYSKNNLAKNSSISVDRNYTRAHNTHSDKECDQYNDHVSNLSIIQANCENELKGGTQCKFDLNIIDPLTLRYGMCVSKPLHLPGYSYSDSLDQLLIFGGSLKKTYALSAITNINYYYNYDKLSTIYSNVTKMGLTASSSNQIGNESFEEVGTYPTGFANNYNTFACSSFNLPMLCQTQEGANCKWDDANFQCINTAPDEGISLMKFTQKDNSHFGFGGFNQNLDCAIFTTQNQCSNIIPNQCSWDSSTGKCNNYSQNMSIDHPMLYNFNGASKKWSALTPSGDPNETTINGSPTERYQHGMVYVPTTNSVYIVGGLRKFECGEFLTESMCSLTGEIAQQCSWKIDKNECSNRVGFPGKGWVQGPEIGKSEIWKLSLDNISLDGTGTSEWEKICGSQTINIKDSNGNNILNPAHTPCGIPEIYPDLNKSPGSVPTTTSVIWNPLRQKIYIYFSNSLTVMELDPYTNKIKNSTDGSQVLAGSNQVVYNKKTGRTIGYQRGDVNSANGNLYGWDLNAHEKKYYKTEIKIGAGSKEVANSLKPVIRAFGYTSNSSVAYAGVNAYIYNNTTNTWDFIGSNTAVSRSQMDGQEIFKVYDSSNGVSNYISTEGNVNILIEPKGDPSNGGITNLVIDQVTLKGNF